MSGPTVVVDDFALAALPELERDLARAGAMVMRSFRGLPNPNLLRRFAGAAVVGGPDRVGLLARLERATAAVAAPVIAVLPRGVDAAPELRGPGVVDLLAAGTRGAAERVLLMARVPIVSGRGGDRGAPTAPTFALPGPAVPRPRSDGAAELVAIASSTGGVWVLAGLLRALPARGRAVLVAQHMEGEFMPFLADWLRSASGWPTLVVSAPVTAAPGAAYLPAPGMDLAVEGGAVRAVRPASRYVPSGDRLLRDAAVAAGPDAVGVVLSGMGSDGAEGLAEVARRGGRAVVQDPASAVVPSMPQSALRAVPGARVAGPEGLAPAVAPPCAPAVPPHSPSVDNQCPLARERGSGR